MFDKQMMNPMTKRILGLLSLSVLLLSGCARREVRIETPEGTLVL